tara:strand:- start:49 stop:252 length:204 start_codon:yes stop_codon:yes gene_type:complete
MTELQKISSEIVEIFQNQITQLTEEQSESLNLRNNSVNFYMKLGDEQKALWEAKQTLQYLHEITNDG